MFKARLGLALAASSLVLIGGLVPARAATADDVRKVLAYEPHQKGVSYSVPTPDEMAKCDLKVVAVGAKGSGYELRDPQGRLLRRLFDTVGDNKIHLSCYYKDGVEVYREINTDGKGLPEQYRWLNTGGTRWGLDPNKTGRIDSWKMISAQEVAEEVFAAVQTKEFARLQALLITEDEIKTLALAPTEAARLHDLRAKAEGKFKETLAKLPSLSEKSKIAQVDVGAPQCLPADPSGPKYDLIKHGNVTILCDNGNGKPDWLHTGELIQVGPAWRLVDAPIQGDRAPGGPGSDTGPTDAVLQALLDELNKLDKAAPKSGAAAADVVGYHMKRADLLEKIIARLAGEERDTRVREMADGLSAAAQNSQATNDTAAYDRLVKMARQYADAQPGGNLAGYIVFRQMQAEYAKKLANGGKDLEKIQKDWLESLTKFVQAYPKAEDTSDAVLQLAMVNEFIGDEIAARKWYEKLNKDYADKPQGLKAKGALTRLDLEGKPLQLAGPQLLTGAAFNISQLQGKLVVVYYWASWNQQCLGDFAKLKLLLDQHGTKGVELVCVNLDNTAEEAKTFLTKSPAPGLQLFQTTENATGLDSPLAVQYGIVVLPNLFLVGKDGKVLNRTVQVSNLEAEINKHMK